MKVPERPTELYIQEYKVNDDITVKKIKKKKDFKCWFCNEVVNSVIGICDDCKPYRLPNVK